MSPVSPNCPPNVPKVSQKHSQTIPKCPQITPKVPNLSSNVPKVSPNVPSAPKWPPKVPKVSPNDSLGRSELLGYGFCHVPSTPGCHSLTCVTWRPRGTWGERLRRFWLGGGPQLLNPDPAYAPDRFRLRTEAAGTVRMELGVILRHFQLSPNSSQGVPKCPQSLPK
uniref:B9 domain-containing protein 2 n=1 Tax=Anas zonorhyncha TaxID=75864 RepID=A0A8B9UF32_9AVES